MHRVITTVVACLIVAGITSASTLPEPDLILYGQVCLADGPASDQDNVSVIARTMVDGQPKVVGQYSMGAEASASDCKGGADCYVLRVRVETVPSGATPSGTAVVLTPQTPNAVDVYVKQGSAQEVLAASAVVDDRGVIRRIDLPGTALSADIDGNGQTSLPDLVLLRAALTGPATESAQPCDRTDINRDGYVDLRDVAVIQAEFTGPAK